MDKDLSDQHRLDFIEVEKKLAGLSFTGTAQSAHMSCHKVTDNCLQSGLRAKLNTSRIGPPPRSSNSGYGSSIQMNRKVEHGRKTKKRRKRERPGCLQMNTSRC